MATLLTLAVVGLMLLALPLLLLKLAFKLVFALILLPFKLIGLVLGIVTGAIGIVFGVLFGIVGVVFRVLFSGVGLIFGLLAALFVLVLVPIVPILLVGLAVWLVVRQSRSARRLHLAS